MFFGLRESLDNVRIGNRLEKIISKESNVVTWVAVTSSPQFSRALCTEIGLAGVPLVVVNATQYEIAGQSDLLTFVKLPSSHC